jgi:ubiquinone/menaquinone biosynthesis C-methylase UbiE
MSDDAANRKAQARATFDRVAPDYDAGGPGCFAHFGRRLTEVVGVEPGQRVLDVATGRGAILIPAAERAGTAGEAIGIDLSEAMANGAREEAARLGLPVRVAVMDGEELDYPDASFDRVFCGFGVMFFPNLERALAGFRRVLRPGGRLGLSSWHVTQTADLDAVLIQAGVMSGSGPVGLTEPEELERPLAAAGFSEVRVVVDRAVFRYDDLDQYWQNARGTGLRRWLDALDAEQTARVRAALAERIRPHQRHDGLYLAAEALLAVATR